MAPRLMLHTYCGRFREYIEEREPDASEDVEESSRNMSLLGEARVLEDFTARANISAMMRM